MNDLVLEIIFATVILTAVTLLIFSGMRFIRSPGNGLLAVWIGLGMLLLGGLLGIAESQVMLKTIPVFNNPATVDIIRDFVCYLGGSIMLGIGMIRRLVSASGTNHFEQLNETLAKTVRDLGSSQELLNSIVRSSISGVMILKAVRDSSSNVLDFECRLMNEEAENLLGHSSSTILHKNIMKYLPCIRNDGLLNEAICVIETGLPFREERQCTHQGKTRWYNIVGVKYGDGLVVSFVDVTERREYETQLQHAALHDTLTGLPNRVLFTDRLAQSIQRSRRNVEYKFAVLFLDLDRFKIINDSLGHEIGDQLLINISDQLRTNLREIDIASRTSEGHLPARLGGDEFVVLLDDIENFRDAITVAERLQREISSPHTIAGHEVITTASIGIVTSEGNYDRPEDIIRDADTAMYQAKKTGKARYVVFDERMHAEVVKRLNLEKELHYAVERKEFTLYYQPIVSIETGRLVGFESLLRWVHPEKGIIEPEEFIELTEELGIIVPIGRWAINEACQQLGRWIKKYPQHENLSFNINLSKQELMDPGLISLIKQAIRNAGISPKSIKVEITESTFIDNSIDLIPVLTKIQEMGIALAMDDFGTGYSSLSFLHTTSMDYLKIDRSFISNASNKRNYAAIIHTIIQLAHNMDMQVVAEGVETQDQLAMLQALDCNFAQGYLFDKPLEPEAAEKLLIDNYRYCAAA
ncbi:MAG: EAL domain-containing protein [Planctomycetes bacterium]|nr:EAL domain-containing protein [Planctomycetota bacterium]